MNSGDYNSINLDEVEFVIDETQSDPFQDHSSYVEFEDISTDFGNPEGGFASREDMDAHVRYVAGLRNVTLAIRDSKGKDGRRPKVRYLCSQGGGYRPKKVTGTRSTKTTKNNCPFWLDGMEYPGGRWYFDVREGRHNHPFPSHAVGSRLGKISPIQLEVIREQENFNLSPSNMLASMKRADPENKSCQKQVYNAVSKVRAQKREGRTPMNNFIHLLRQLNYMYDVRTADESSELGDIVFCHPASFVMVNAYPEVMMIDCTYNTNEYDIPLLEVVGATSTDKTFTIAYAYLNHRVSSLTEHGNSIKNQLALYQKAFTRRCCDLQTAEAEVDLLGDEVDLLYGLVEKIYKVLDHYSPVLQHYFGVRLVQCAYIALHIAFIHVELLRKYIFMKISMIPAR